MLETSVDSALRGLVLGALVQTPTGPWPVQDLRTGDLIDTLDEGPLPLLWMGQTDLFDAAPAVRIGAGTLANAAPLLLAPDHLVMIDGSDCELLFGEAEVLVKARDLVGLPGIAFDTQNLHASYFHLMLDTHQIIMAEGIPVESFHPGLVRFDDEVTELKSLLRATIEPQDIEAIFAETPVLYILTHSEAAVLRNLRLKLIGAHRAAFDAQSAA